MPVKNQRCQPEAVESKENAAPLLCTRTKLKNEVTVWLSPKLKLPTISNLVN